MSTVEKTGDTNGKYSRKAGNESQLHKYTSWRSVEQSLEKKEPFRFAQIHRFKALRGWKKECHIFCVLIPVPESVGT